ncbi:hypothetical protein CTA1_561, partial [Colletotrichum tanaceti]
MCARAVRGPPPSWHTLSQTCRLGPLARRVRNGACLPARCTRRPFKRSLRGTG